MKVRTKALPDGSRRRHRLTVYAQGSKKLPGPVDYRARLQKYQPLAMTNSQSRRLHDENRGKR